MVNRSSVLKAFVIASLVVMCAGVASAQDERTVKWTYIEAGYLSVDVDNLSDSGDSWFAGGSFALGKSFHIIGQYADGDLDDTNKREDWRIGVGWHGLFGPQADLVAEAYWLDTEFSNGSSVSDDGYRLTGGIRWVPIKLLEVDGFVNVQTYGDEFEDGDFDDESYEVRAILHLGRIGVGASWEMYSDVDQYNGFVRFSFR